MDTISTTPNHLLVDTLLNTSSMAAAYFDSHYKVNKCNGLFIKALDLNSQPGFLYETGLFQKEELNSVKEKLEEEEASVINLTIETTLDNGSKLDVNVKIVGEYYENKWVGGIVFLNDLTPKEPASVENTPNGKPDMKLLQKIYHHSPLGLLRICEKTAKILGANGRICEMLGYGETEMKAMTAYDITHVDDRIKHKKNFEKVSLREKDVFNLKKRYVKKNGKVIWVNIAVTVLRDDKGTPVYSLAMIQDITGKHEDEELIKKQMEALNLQNQKLEKYIDSNLQLENFAYIASHDLKAPLRTIGNFAQLLKRRRGKDFSEEEHEFMDFILEGVKDMSQLIEDLLVYSKINSTENIVQELNLPHILNNVLRNLGATISECKAEVTIGEVPVTFMANKTKVTQLFQNLIANGIKFQKEGSIPKVQINCTEEEKFWQFEIIDNGIGIKEEYYDQIFALFKRLNGKQEYDGSGIGLAYCRSVVEQHGGEIWLKSEEGKGTSFFFTLKKEKKNQEMA